MSYVTEVPSLEHSANNCSVDPFLSGVDDGGTEYDDSENNSPPMVRYPSDASGSAFSKFDYTVPGEVKLPHPDVYNANSELIPADIYETYLLQPMDTRVNQEVYGQSRQHQNWIQELGDREPTSHTEAIPRAPSPLQENVRVPGSSHSCTFGSELGDRVDFAMPSQYDVYVGEQNTMQSLPPAESFSMECHEPFVITSTDPRLSGQLDANNLTAESVFDQPTDPQVSSPTSNQALYSHEVYNGVRVISQVVSQPHNNGSASQRYAYPSNPVNYSDLSQQPEYIYSTEQFGQCNTLPMLDQYHAPVYGTLEPGCHVPQSSIQTNRCDTLLVPDFSACRPMELVYEFTESSEGLQANYPVAYGSNSQLYQTVYSEFEHAIPVLTEELHNAHFYCEHNPVGRTTTNASTYDSYTMIPQFSDQTAVPIDSVMVFESDSSLSATKSISACMDGSNSAIWSNAVPNVPPKPTTYEMAYVNMQPQDQNATNPGGIPYTLGGQPHYLSPECASVPPSSMCHTAIYPQPPSYLPVPNGVNIVDTTQCPTGPPSTTFLHNPALVTTSSSDCTQSTVLRCPHCAREFSRPSHLEIHMRVHTGALPYSCILCGRQFNQASNLRRHLSSHKTWPLVTSVPSPIIEDGVSNADSHPPGTGQPGDPKAKPKRWICNFCGEQFISYTRLRGHMIRHKDRRVYACVFESCSQAFSSAESFLDHVIKQHVGSDQTGINACSTCGRNFLDATQYIQHWLPRRRGLPFRCGPQSLTGARKRDQFEASVTRAYQRIPIRTTICQAQAIQRRRRVLVQSDATRSPGALRSVSAMKTQLRLLTLHRPRLARWNQLYRCPLCPRNCRTLNRLCQHLSTYHVDTLASAVQQQAKIRETPVSSSNTPILATTTVTTAAGSSHLPSANALQSDDGTGVETDLGSKPAFFLLQVEGSLNAKRGVRLEQPDTMPSLNPQSSVEHVSALCCEFCGRRFQKLKFFEDHRIMCKQAIEERERRQRLRLHRQMRFRDPDQCRTSEQVANNEPRSPRALASSAPAVTDLESDATQFNTDQCHSGLRRSKRVKTFRVLWNSGKRRNSRRARSDQMENTAVSLAVTSTGDGPSISNATITTTTHSDFLDSLSFHASSHNPSSSTIPPTMSDTSSIV